jgi:ABC transport system ATP-binding/permease protein
MNELEKDRLFETPRRMIQKYAPVYMRPLSNYGRSQFYSPYKKMGNIAIDTFWFNIIVLWLVTLCLYIALYYNLLQKALNITGNFRLASKDS